MLRPPIDAEIQRIDHADGLRPMSTILPDAVEACGAPRIARQEAVQVATEHAPVAPADLGARIAHERLALISDRVASTVADLVSAEHRVRHGPHAHCPALPRPLLRLEHGADRQQRSEEHTSELQSRPHLVCRLLLEKKKKEVFDYNSNRKTKETKQELIKDTK